MPSNDQTVLAIPHIQCPSCKMSIHVGNLTVNKFSKAQRKAQLESYNSCSPGSSQESYIDNDMSTEYSPEQEFVIITCDNIACKQYNVFKVLKLPKLIVPSMRVSLE